MAGRKKNAWSIDTLELSCRARNPLVNNGYLTVGQLRAASDTDLLRVPNIGKVCLREIRDAIDRFDAATSKPKPRRKTEAEREAERMEKARDALADVIADLRRHEAVTPENVALVSNAVVVNVLLEHEIGRRLTGSLLPWEKKRHDSPLDN